MTKTNINTNANIEEKILNPISGMLMLMVLLAGMIGSIVLFVSSFEKIDESINQIVTVGSVLLFVIICPIFAGLKIVNPKEALVLTLFGKYYGTIRENGFFFVNPFVTGFNPAALTLADVMEGETAEIQGKKNKGKNNALSKSLNKKISTKIITLNNTQQKVNDVAGNPIIIGSVVIWRVIEPTKAVFNVENYNDYLSAQCDSVIRNTARLYPYDNMENDEEEMTLRGSSIEIAERMRFELQQKVEDAGIEIIEVRITHLAYAEEIAGAMLRRQQATATVAAREKIVEGAVGMVRMALEQLEDDDIIILDDERKAAMVSNLLVVLCGDKDAQPVVNSGSIY